MGHVQHDEISDRESSSAVMDSIGRITVRETHPFSFGGKSDETEERDNSRGTKSEHIGGDYR